MDVAAYLEGLMESDASDVVLLAHMDAPTARQLKRLDLRLLSEYERKPGGVVRVKLLDRGALAAAVLKEPAALRPAGTATADFLAAMTAAAAEVREDFDV